MSAKDLTLVLAGYGGQGLLFAGKVVAYAGLMDDMEVSWLPSYGPEMRGGTANCSVTLSEKPIGSPLIINPSALIAMNLPSLKKFENDVLPGGVIVYDSSVIPEKCTREDVTVIAVPATTIAEQSGLSGLANIILTGRLYKELGFCRKESLYNGLKKCVPASKAALLELNLKALEIGLAHD